LVETLNLNLMVINNIWFPKDENIQSKNIIITLNNKVSFVNIR